jgi:FkbM family methyltransferase
MKQIIPYKLKEIVKRLALAVGLYRPARYINDRLTRKQFVEILADDIVFFKSQLRPNSLCFDIGSNIGEKTEALLRAGMRVVAVEPQPLCVKEIEARCKGYDNLKICQTAVGAELGEAQLYLSDIFHASSSLDSNWGPNHGSITVPLTTLDALISEFGHPDYCKIDVEGYEFNVIQGLTKAISLISFEFHMTDRDLDKTFACLDHLAGLAKKSILLNISPAEHFHLSFPEWKSFDDFKIAFPESFRNRQEFNYGDVWVRSA